VKQSVMLYTGHSILESGFQKKDAVAQAQGLMILAEYAALIEDVVTEGDRWATHVKDLVKEGLDQDVSSQILPEAITRVIDRLAYPCAYLGALALTKVAEARMEGNIDLLIRAVMMRTFWVEMDAVLHKEKLELEERIARAMLTLPLEIRPTEEEQAGILGCLNRIIPDEEALNGYTPIKPGTALSGALALRIAVDAFTRGMQEEELAAILYRLGVEVMAQKNQAEIELLRVEGEEAIDTCIECAAALLRSPHGLTVTPEVIARAKRRDFPSSDILIGGPVGTPSGVTIH
jgi:hypothetical protein